MPGHGSRPHLPNLARGTVLPIAGRHGLVWSAPHFHFVPCCIRCTIPMQNNFFSSWKQGFIGWTKQSWTVRQRRLLTSYSEIPRVTPVALGTRSIAHLYMPLIICSAEWWCVYT